MQRKQVKSSNIVSIGYDETKKVLEIEFNNGVYQYIKVPVEIFKGLMSAESHGKYFYLNIKGKYEFARFV
ncbi:hypothetical protein LCGC14_1388250 [marine sediment metagenome]|uniref:KTSC domain-containing protein n=1 Tax=marine sediment metagenome TaxID=412755 RepID=A0A0F9MG92_9ZZZZ